MRETEAQKDEGTCPKSQTDGEAGLWGQAVELLACRTEMGSYRGHIVGWVSKSPWGPLLRGGVGKKTVMMILEIPEGETRSWTQAIGCG